MIDFFDEKVHPYSISIEEIRKAPNEIPWYEIVNSQKLSEDFIREFENYLDWWDICLYQKLSKEFIAEFSDKIIFQAIIRNILILDEVKEFCRIFL